MIIRGGLLNCTTFNLPMTWSSIEENAEFLKKDLDSTISQLNEYMRQRISSKLDEEFSAYAKAMQEAQQLALGSLQKTAQDIQTHRTALAPITLQFFIPPPKALVLHLRPTKLPVQVRIMGLISAP